MSFNVQPWTQEKNIINNHQGKIHEYTVQMNDRYMSVADKFIYSPYQYIGIEFNWPIFTTLCTDKFLAYYCSNRSGKINMELHIDWSTTTKNVPPHPNHNCALPILRCVIPVVY